MSHYKLTSLRHRIFKPISTGFFFFVCFSLQAQVTTNDSAITGRITSMDTSTRSKQKDIMDVFRQWFRLHPSQKTDNIQPGDKPVLSFLPAAGYTLQTRLAAILSGNIAFFTADKPYAKLSVINANVTYTQNRQFTIPVQLNVWLKGDKYNLVGDWRYMKYPQSTYGLGSDADVANENPMNYQYIRIYQFLLKKIAADLSAGIGYNLDYHWNISEKGLSNGMVSDYEKYGAVEKTISSGPSVNLIYDNRKNPINPSSGLFASLVLRDNVKWMGSSGNWQSAVLDIRKYIQLPGRSKNVLAFWSYNWMILGGKAPYLDLPAVGWDNFNNTGRGFIQGRFRGNVMVYAESEYRFNITRNGLVGGVLFLNGESFSGAPSKELEAIQFGKGFGLRIKLNKKSNTNIAVDYGFGTEHMRGLFVNVGEVF